MHTYFNSILKDSLFMHAAHQSAFKQKLLQNIFCISVFECNLEYSSMNEWLLLAQGEAECNYVIHECNYVFHECVTCWYRS